jgi:Caspase domain
MAGKSGAGRGLILGLVVAALGLTALAQGSQAGRAREAQESSMAVVKQQRPLQRLARAETGANQAPSPEQVAAIARTQRCLAELGYYKGEVDGKRGRVTWAAFWQFKHEHGLASQSDLLAEPVQQKIATLCKISDDMTTVYPAVDPLAPDQVEEPADPGTEGEDDVALASPDSGPEAAPDTSDAEEGTAASGPGARLDLDCLAEDLVSVLRRAHGLGVDVKTCERPCVSPPTGLPQAQMDKLQASGGVVWCRTCVPFAGQLALDEVKRIERAGNIELCPTPPRQLAKYGEGVTDGLRSYMRVRELYRALPPAAEDPDAVAVIIGNRSYDRLPRSVTSYNDADAVYAFLTEHLGYRPDNIIDMRDAKKADFERVFGAEPGFDGELARLVEGKPNAKVVVYYSGHGAADEAQTETYLLPVDTEPYGQAFGGYKLSTLYANLAKLKVKSILVLLETEYGRDHGASVLPPNLPDALNTALPKDPTPALTVLAATDRGQRSLIDVTYDIGLFTRYVIEGLAGGADLPPVGNGDGALDSAEIYAFTAAFVDLAARKTYGVLQHPVFTGGATNVLTMTSAGVAPSGSN